MLSLVVSLLVLALVVYLVIYVLGMLPLPEPARMVINVLIAIVVIIYLARLLGVSI